jgi:spermidine dehydrogenase
MADAPDDEERNRLGLDTPITRRDFVNGALVGAGGVMLGTRSAGSLRAGIPAPDTFTGYGGVGDYAKANGNTWPVVQAAHRLRDGAYDASALAAAKPEGDFDLVVVGGGIAGLSAAFYFTKAVGPGRRVLLLDNHSMLGGEARQNEFSVAGVRLLGPQGSNDFAVPAAGSGSLADAFFTEFALPREYSWQPWDAQLKPLSLARDNYSNMDGFQESQVDVGHFFGEGPDGKALWRRNIWSNGLKDTPFSETARRDLLRWRADNGPVSEAQDRYLDTLTYKDYLERVRGYDPAVTRLVEPIVGLLSGVSADAASARLGRQLVESPDRPMALSFPGGNSPFPRALLRGLLPAALPGKDFNSLMYGRVDFAALDRAQSTRIRLEAMALRVEHASSDSRGSRLRVTYEKGGALFKVGARTVVMASGGWVNKHLLVDMPEDLRSAYDQFSYAPALIVNVALRQWRFLYDLDITACRWFDDAESFGYCCNLRQTMTSGGSDGPPLHPDRPAVLSFYLGLPIPGLTAAEQGAAARAQFLATPYAEFELRIRRQMTRMFAAYGFKPDRDIAAIVLNRWGHARLIEPPGFHYGRDGRASPLERVREGYGHVAIGHSELNGGQHWGSALEYGKKAGERAAAML